MADIIWDWVGEAKGALRESGRERLAHLMTQISWYTCDEKHAQVDAIYPEALALAREAGNPWVEVFIRHWNLQSRILHRHQVGDWMAEAVSLIEFANRPETRDCPQSICTTQDLVNCYGNIDGPGYAEERITATRETLARIDPSWSCYQCIGGELVAALNDAGRTDEAMKLLDTIEIEVRQARPSRSPYPMVDSRVHTLRQLGRLDEALAVNAEGRKHINDDGDIRKRALERALLLALKGDGDEAVKGLLSFETINGTHSSYLDWSETHRILAELDPLRNDWTLEDSLRTLADDLLSNGVLRDAFQILIWRGELACLRGRASTAERIVTQAEAIIPRLRVPLDAPRLLAELRQRIVTVPKAETVLGDDPDAYLETTGLDPEEDLISLSAAHGRWPGHREITLRLASALRAMGLMTETFSLFEAWLTDHPDDLDFINLWGSTCLEVDDLARAEQAFDRMNTCDQPEADLVARWFGYRLATAKGHASEAMEHLRYVVASEPSAINATQALVGHLVDEGALSDALEHLDRLCRLNEDVGGYDWERMAIGTCLEKWSSVRDSAGRIGWTLEGDGPIDEAWELTKIRFSCLDGDEIDLYAQRTGPVTAKILSMNDVDDTCHYLDRVVFRATPLNEAPEEEDEEHVWVYPLMRVTQSAGYDVYAIYGVHPGEDEANGLWQKLVDLGCDVSVRSDESYELWREDDDTTYLGLYTLLAVPAECDRASLASLFSTATAAYPAPLVCPDLWDALDQPEAAKAQRVRVEPWGF